MESLTGMWRRARERLARWGIIAVLWLTQTTLTNDTSQDVVVREWMAENMTYGKLPVRKESLNPHLGREYSGLSMLKRFKKSKSKELN